MIHLSWNCQGLGRTLTTNALEELVRKNRPMFVFLSETRMNKGKLESVRRKIGYPNSHCVDSLGSSGVLAFFG